METNVLYAIPISTVPRIGHEWPPTVIERAIDKARTEATCEE